MSYRKTFIKLKRKLQSGQTREQAVNNTVQERLTSEYKKEDFDDLERLKKKTYPPRGRLNPLRLLQETRFKFIKRLKRQRINATFGVNGERLGLIVVQPELFSNSRVIRQYLKALGIQIVLEKNTILSKDQVLRVYEDRHLKKTTFPFAAASFTKTPSKIIIFKHLSLDGYIEKSQGLLEYLKKFRPQSYPKYLEKIPTRNPQGLFDLLFKGSYRYSMPGTLREEISKPNNRQAKYEKGQSEKAKAFDPFGFMKGMTEKEVDQMMGGVHTPRQQDISYHVASLLSLKELDQIQKVLNKK